MLFTTLTLQLYKERTYVFFKLRTKVRTSTLSTRNTLTLNEYKLNIYATHALNPYHQMRQCI